MLFHLVSVCSLYRSTKITLSVFKNEKNGKEKMLKTKINKKII